jgi:hypothetical protein
MTGADVDLWATWLSNRIVGQRARVATARQMLTHAHPAYTEQYTRALAREELALEDLLDQLAAMLLTPVTA